MLQNYSKECCFNDMKSAGGEVILHYILYYVYDLNNWEFINLPGIMQRKKRRRKSNNKKTSVNLYSPFILYLSKKKARQSNLI